MTKVARLTRYLAGLPGHGQTWQGHAALDWFHKDNFAILNRLLEDIVVSETSCAMAYRRAEALRCRPANPLPADE